MLSPPLADVRRAGSKSPYVPLAACSVTVGLRDHCKINAHGDGLARRFGSTRSDVEVADSKPEAVGSKR